MKIQENNEYIELLRESAAQFPNWKNFEGKTIFISGATGMIGSFLIDSVMLRNEELEKSKRTKIIAVSRNRETAEKRFSRWFKKEEFFYYAGDITQFSEKINSCAPDFLIHAASTTHPIQYASEPINTIFANVFGTRNMLELAAKKPDSRFLLLSSVEIYGENRGDVDYFDESYCGYLDCNTLRADYPEAKRLCETMCQAYIKEKNVDAVIIRLPRIYGPTLRSEDTKALSQFIKKGLEGENIVLKSEGKQLYSYAFVSDAVLGILYVLAQGKTGEAYNLGDAESDICLKDLAELVALNVKTKVVFEIPDEKERAGYSTAIKALMKPEKLKKLGWRSHYNIKDGIKKSLSIMKSL